MTIAANIAARNAHTARLLSDQPPARATVALTASEAADALFGWVYKQPGMATLADCQAMLTRISDERGQDDATALLKRFGLKRIKDLFAGEYVRFFEYASTALYYGCSPNYGWTCRADVLMPEFVRDRWLLWHDESDCLWEVRGKLGSELDDGAVEDVSGKSEFERRFAEQRGAVAPIIEQEEEL